MGLGIRYVDFCDRAALLQSFTAKTRMVWMESPTNPVLHVYDIRDIATICKEKGVLLVFDNTFATPYLQNPLELGADIVMQAGTKYIGGHSDITMGFVSTSREDLYRALAPYYLQFGACPSPFDCYLALRGLKTLAVRMRRAQRNAMRLAEFISTQPLIEKVFYPGLPTDSGHALCQRQSRGPGAILSFLLKGADLAKTQEFCKAVRVLTYAGSVGGVEGLICIPAIFTHGSLPAEFRKKVGVTDNLVFLLVSRIMKTWKGISRMR